MIKKLRIVLAQINPIVGDLNGNLEKHIRAAITARDELSADIIVFPELSLTGYPPEDLLFRHSFIRDTEKTLAKFVNEVKDIYCVVGHPKNYRKKLYNACSMIFNGNIMGSYAKQRLPNYGVFDECRYFKPGQKPCVVPVHGIPIGLVICEDVWTPAPIRQAVAHGARLILAPNASPFEINKHNARLSVLSKRVAENNVPIAYINMVCGQDELVFDGGSMVMNDKGELAQLAGFFNETLHPVNIHISDTTSEVEINSVPDISEEEKIYQALVLGLRDYVNKNNFPSVVLGLSGGIDSALTLAIAVDALGSDRVKAILLPSRYTSEISIEDAEISAKNLNVEYETISIEPTYQQFLSSLQPSFNGKKADITEENIQARCRAIILMALSNKYSHLVLSTGNRTELAVGYCTLYGDMAGGYAVLKDIPKMMVYKLAKYRNQLQAIIPERTIKRAPTAELAPNQKDQDTLPPYPMLDDILYLYLNEGLSTTDIIAKGFEKNTVERIVGLIHKNEYKRKQAALGPHINHKSFVKDWRYPVVNGYKK